MNVTVSMDSVLNFINSMSLSFTSSEFLEFIDHGDKQV